MFVDVNIHPKLYSYISVISQLYMDYININFDVFKKIDKRGITPFQFKFYPNFRHGV